MSYHIHVDGAFTLDRPLTVEHKVTLEKFAQERHAPGGVRIQNGVSTQIGPDKPSWAPDYPWCQWVPSEDGTSIQYTEDDISGYRCTEWLQVIVDRFLKPWGYMLNGRATWGGEEAGDLGVIVVRDNEVREADAIITYPDPFA